MVEKIVTFLFLICLIASAGRGWHWAKDGFNINRIRSAFPASKEEPIPEEVAAALKQPYSYLGQGRQYYAFKSSDGKYVLKLPRLDRYEIPFWLQACPFPFLDEYRKQIGIQRLTRLEGLMESARIASEELREQTAVLYVHFHKTEGKSHYTEIIDRLGRHFQVELNHAPFVLQEKKSLMALAFDGALASADRDQAKAILESYLKIIAYRSNKGIYSKDYSYFRNYGIEEGQKEDRCFEIDIGSFYHTNTRAKTALQETVDHISPWLGNIDPQLKKWFRCKAEEITTSCDF